jgi:ubiquinol-cytochrome c reductase cytochrome c subunit
MVSARAALLLAAFVVAPVLLAGCATRDEPAPYRPPVERRAAAEVNGGQLYSRDCAWCHGMAGRGSEYGPGIENSGDASVHFYLSTGRMPLDHPKQSADRAAPIYTPEEIDAIVEYTSVFSTGPEIPDVDPDRGEYALGADLYLQNCAACHSSTGAGAIFTTGNRVPHLFDATPEQIAEAMLIGPRGMPIFADLDEDEVDSIVRYVVALQEAPDRGGNQLGKLGPFSEGAVAWIVGLGALLLIIRWIGSRADE